jgi:hypothetical protein
MFPDVARLAYVLGHPYRLGKCKIMWQRLVKVVPACAPSNSKTGAGRFSPGIGSKKLLHNL